MRLDLKNVGKIREAYIEMNGITVIAGENNTGKSTVGKMLFCVLHSFCKIDSQVDKERQITIERAVAGCYRELTKRVVKRFDPADFAKEIVKNSKCFTEGRRNLLEELKNLCLQADSHFENYFQDSLEQLADKILSYLKVEDGEIRALILQRRLEAEFSMKIGHLNRPDEKTVVHLNIPNGDIHFEIEKNKDIHIDRYLNLSKEIIYIDDPFVVDDLNGLRVRKRNSFEHRGDLLEKIADREKAENFSAVDELIVRRKMENVFGTINEICDGELLADESGTYVYRMDGLNGGLDVENLSTGMKSFVILRKLLQNGIVDENGVIILDEPEIHLHPEWQLKFAEMIVLLQKEFRVQILLNTHSPYFLNAIEVYSEKYEIEKKCRYYLTDEKEGTASIRDVSQNRELIYEKLARPLQELENMEYRNGNAV